MHTLIYVDASAAIPTNLTLVCLCERAGLSVAGRGVKRSRQFNIKLQLFSLHIFNFSCSVWSSILETLKIHNIWSNIDHSYFACFIPAQTKTDRISFENNSSLGITEAGITIVEDQIRIVFNICWIWPEFVICTIQTVIYSNEEKINIDKCFKHQSKINNLQITKQINKLPISPVKC